MNDALTILQRSVETQRDFFDWNMLFYVGVPFVVLIVLARTRRRKPWAPPHVVDADFEATVLRSEKPVLVHFYRTWSIGDAVMVNQARRIAERNEGRIAAWWLDVDANPETVARFPHLETPAFLFFVDGTCVFQCEGVVDEADVHREMWLAFERRQRMMSRPASPSG